jgi:uncharacterized protein (UPF0305 family)|tara:strand:- start:119 stop:364 length:246 start_codon:yes stop_codon:yes gene_type:complete
MRLPRRVEQASKEKIIEVSQQILFDTLNDIKVQLESIDDKVWEDIEKELNTIEELILNHEYIDLEYMIDNQLRLEGTGLKT